MYVIYAYIRIQMIDEIKTLIVVLVRVLPVRVLPVRVLLVQSSPRNTICRQRRRSVPSIDSDSVQRCNGATVQRCNGVPGMSAAYENQALPALADSTEFAFTKGVIIQ